MSRNPGSARLIICIAMATLVSACHETPPPPPTVVALHIAAAGDINPDMTGRPSSVVVRYYLLAQAGTFRRADYFQLHDKERSILQSDLIDQEEILLAPGTSSDTVIECKPGAAFLAVAASFRDIDRASWRAVVPIQPNRTNNISVRLSELHLIVGPALQ